jgi:hypothetical protein
MTEKKIYTEKPEIKKMAYEKYPEKRFTCHIKKASYEGKRWAYAVRLFESVGLSNEMQFK